MTKDRRLGRGLAALLGTPSEEEGYAQDGNGAVPTASTARSSLPPTASRQIAAATTGSSTPRSSGASPQTDSSRNLRQVGESSDSSKGNTGSVPLRTQGGEATKELVETRIGGGTLELNVNEIDNNPFQPRRKFNEEEIASLAESIREHQQLQPILVRQVAGRYQLISGERRLRATIHAGLKTIRAEVREADDRLVAELAIVENLQRKDLDAIEKALSFRRYIDQHKCTQEDLAKRLKIDRSTIANLMRLLELPTELQGWIQGDRITAGHARALLPLGDEDQQMEFARLIEEESWSVREAERRVSERLAAEDGRPVQSTTVPVGRGSRKRSTPQLAALEQQLRLSLGAKTEIRQTATGRGKIVISFANAEEFERLCALICPATLNKAA